MQTDSNELKDMVAVGNVSIESHDMLLINKTKGIITPDWSAAGLAGLLPSSVVSSVAKMFHKTQVALFYGRRPTFKSDNTAGSMTFGGIDSMYCEEDGNVVGTVSDAGILFPINRITLGSEILEEYAVDAALILETRYTTIPRWHMEKIASAIGAVYDNATERQYAIDCARVASLPGITLQLSGTSYYMGSANYTEKMGERCYLALLTRKGAPGWLLGTSFTRQYCHVINYQTGTYELHSVRGSFSRASTTTASTPPSPPLTHGAVAAIACGCTVAVLFLVGIAFFIYYKRRIRQRYALSYKRLCTGGYRTCHIAAKKLQQSRRLILLKMKAALTSGSSSGPNSRSAASC